MEKLIKARFILTYVFFQIFYLIFQTSTIYGGDAGDLVTTSYVGGIAHPPGFPLYSLLGYIVHFIPYSSPAWRVALLSSIAISVALTLLTYFLYRITRSFWIGILSAATLGSTYVIWLYSIVPEVFMLNVMFLLLLLVLGYSFSLKPSKKLFYSIGIITGIAISHHPIIVFALPSILLLMFIQQDWVLKLSIKTKFAGLAVLIFFWLLPYAWAYYAAYSLAPLSWSDPINIENMIHLITRNQYGSFQSGINYAQTIQSRLLQFPALLEFYIQDFSILGLIFALLGLGYTLKRHRNIGISLLTGFILTGPLYFFYASYFLRTPFQIATAERFLTQSYVFMSIFIGLGFFAVIEIVKKNLHTEPQKKLHSLLMYGILGVFLLLPLGFFISNYPKLSILKNDRTAENLGIDLLDSTEKNSILFLRADHPVFNTQYVYYALGHRNDVIPIHITNFMNGTHRRLLKDQFPDLDIKPYDNEKKDLIEFVEKHYPDYPIFSSTPFSYIPRDFVWIPEGLVYRLYSPEDTPTDEETYNRNSKLWESYHDPLAGSLGSYDNLMQINIAEHYRDAAIRTGSYITGRGEYYEDALTYYDIALRIDPSNGYAHYLEAVSFIALEQCDNAKEVIDKGYEYRQDDPGLYYESMRTLYLDCYKNETEAEKWSTKIDELSKEKEVILEEL